MNYGVNFGARETSQTGLVNILTSTINVCKGVDPHLDTLSVNLYMVTLYVQPSQMVPPLESGMI